MSSVDAMLYRPLKSGIQYNGLIPPYQGQEYNFDTDTDNSTTYDTLKYMAQWSNKYAYQMKQIAPLLKGRTIQETVNNIYQFLYNHFQYKLDGSLQNLYSPSAAWHFRKTGFDCKTYSLLASCILQNLNIKHSFRMVQQLGIMPGEWSHVYVIVTADNKEYVIDATTHTNKQVSYTKKYDHEMKHLGLASPSVYGLGCTCQGTPITRKGLGAPGNLEATIANFHQFLNELERKGLPKETADRMLTLVRYNVEKGIDPNMHEIVQKAVLPNGQLGATPFSSYSTPNMSFNSKPTFSLTTPSVLTKPSVLTSGGASSGGFMSSGAGGIASSLVGNMSVGGVKVGGLVSAATGLLTGNPMAAIGLITSLIPMEKTFGAVFANGFDLSCWGASYSEQKAKAFLEKRTPEIIQESGVQNGLNTNTFDRFLNLIDVEIFWAKNGQQSKYAKCTQKGYALQEKGFQTLLINTIDSIQQNGYKLIPNGKKPTTIEGKTSTYDSYIVVPPAQQQQQQQLTYQTVTNPDGSTSQVPVLQDAVKSGSSGSTSLLIGGALLALKLLI